MVLGIFGVKGAEHCVQCVQDGALNMSPCMDPTLDQTQIIFHINTPQPQGSVILVVPLRPSPPPDAKIVGAGRGYEVLWWRQGGPPEARVPTANAAAPILTRVNGAQTPC
jgi:hypothetical protein